MFHLQAAHDIFITVVSVVTASVSAIIPRALGSRVFATVVSTNLITYGSHAKATPISSKVIIPSLSLFLN